jgi:magnesium chelatase family protein
MVSVAPQRGLKRVYVPARDAAEAALVDGLEVYKGTNLAAMIDHLNGVSKLARFEMPPMPVDEEVVYPVDMADVKGQEHVKRAVEVCAAGSHNVLGLWTTIQLAVCAAG